MINSTSMKTLERATLYEKIKNLSIENFDIELKDEDLDEYSLEQLTEINNKLNEIVKYSCDKWLLAYVENTTKDFLEAIFKFDERSIFYDYSKCTVEEIVKNEIWDFVQDCVIEKIMDCLDCEQFLEDYMYFEETEYGYITTW